MSNSSSFKFSSSFKWVFSIRRYQRRCSILSEKEDEDQGEDIDDEDEVIISEIRKRAMYAKMRRKFDVQMHDSWSDWSKDFQETLFKPLKQTMGAEEEEEENEKDDDCFHSVNSSFSSSCFSPNNPTDSLISCPDIQELSTH